MQTMQRIVAAVVAAALALTTTAQGNGIPTTGRYVTDGLIAWYDGIDNAGSGNHDNSATVWKDLSGNGYDGTVGANVAWIANGWSNAANGQPIILPLGVTAALAASPDKTFTLEFSCKPSRDDARQNFFSQYDGVTDSWGFEHNASGVSSGAFRWFYANWPATATSVIVPKNAVTTIALVSDNTAQNIFKNGVWTYERSGGVNPVKSGVAFVIGGDNNRPANAFQGEFYTLRLYNRKLTASEVAQNAAADAERIRSTSDNVWMNLSGGDWNTAANWSAGVPDTSKNAAIVAYAANGLNVDVGGAVPSNTGFEVMNAAGGTNTVRVLSGGALPISGGAIALDAGGALSIAEGGAVTISGASADALSIADGALLSMTGGSITVNEADAASGDVRVKLAEGGDVSLSGNSSVNVIGGAMAVCEGSVTLSGNAMLFSTIYRNNNGTTANSDTGNRFSVGTVAGGDATLSVNDAASVTNCGSTWSQHVIVADNIKGGHGVLNWNTSTTLRGQTSFVVGFRNGYGEFNITDGQVLAGRNGMRIGACATYGTEYECATGVVSVAGGSIFGESNIDNNENTFYGLVVGAGNYVKLDKPGFFKGTLMVSDGSVTNAGNKSYFGVGIGCAEGDVVQTGGEVLQVGQNANAYPLIVGAFGGTGRYMVSNGLTSVRSDVYVGGCATNSLPSGGSGLFTYCPVTNHCAAGTLTVAGGMVEIGKALKVGTDGSGCVAVGPAGRISANTAEFATTSAEVTGGDALASRVSFKFGREGVGTIAVADILTIGEGATLSVDVSDYAGDGATFPLITFASCSGNFASVNVVGAASGSVSVEKTSGGYFLKFKKATLIMMK